jgi:hypothetical protein
MGMSRRLLLASLLAGGALAAAAHGGNAVAPKPCPTHDVRSWHALVDPVRRCHYDHEHKDDPHIVDGVFGKPGAWFGGTGISYPWQTFKGSGPGHPAPPAEAGLLENDLKHEGYGYGVRRGLRCKPAFDADGCLTDIRMQVHALATVHDATTRFHSFSLEARGCIGGRCGIVREGGWIDYGRLSMDFGKPYAIDVLELPGPPVNRTGNPVRLHKSPPNEQRDATWYSQPGPWNSHLSNIGLRFGMWGPVDTGDLTRVLAYCPVSARGKVRPGCRETGTWLETHLIPIRIPAELDARDGKRDGLVTFRGYTDRYGHIRRKACTRPGLDCVPLVIEHMPVGYYQYRDDVQGIAPADHNATPPGRSWLCVPGAASRS